MTAMDRGYKVIYIEDSSGTHKRNDNIDVVVRFDDGLGYAATFITPINIDLIMKRYETTGECLGGTYFWCSSMIIVHNLDRETIEAAIKDLIGTGEFFDVFEGPSIKDDDGS